ncbi:AzlD domain-containing protein [Nakamurella lactea]|uniref:AzlD domain-containing protein n=1 Tax=Nakamurella lactea TaxID=459515 RepID=UPI0004247CA8|nr:AzlD domain-containing protein [Nakamurella lactea]
MIWAAILVGCAGCFAFKWAGLSVPASVLANRTAQRIAALLPIALLAALIATQTFGAGQHLVLDARVAGVAVAAVAAWRRWPFLVIVVLAAGTAAVLRLLVPGS